MSRIFFREELEGVATFWQIFRRDGVTLGFVSHDRDLYFGGIPHRAAPGILPSAIRLTADLGPDSAEIRGALAHDSISSADLATGRYDGALVRAGAVDWETLENAVLYNGSIGNVSEDGGSFSAELKSAKAALDVDLVPRTSPTCRAEFCGPGCNLSAARYTTIVEAVSVTPELGQIRLTTGLVQGFDGGVIRWLGGPHSGSQWDIVGTAAGALVVNESQIADIEPGTRARILEGCDHTLATCGGRFGNSVNFQGEPYLPGNDRLARYPAPK
ncbi:DUF2163 domain-containing protein [Altererythrobacter aquiaggeris]|uniref:DUF2163 domain-containing protein n=1 Tax=Aestuarierythrobacter aquiaggeris TaxID=1898396 RepID=UPI00301A41D6